ncbi:MAG: alpha/beta fold hydrolase, partial [Verrucomicrobiota bacterium]
ALVLHGAEDKIIPVDRARELAQTIPDAKYVEIAGAGHASPLEAPMEVAEALFDLVSRSETALHRSPKRDPHADGLPGVTWAPTERGL